MTSRTPAPGEARDHGEALDPDPFDIFSTGTPRTPESDPVAGAPAPPLSLHLDPEVHRRLRMDTRRKATKFVQTIEMLLALPEIECDHDGNDILGYRIGLGERILDTLLGLRARSGEDEVASDHVDKLGEVLYRARRRVRRVDNRLRNDSGFLRSNTPSPLPSEEAPVDRSPLRRESPTPVSDPLLRPETPTTHLHTVTEPENYLNHSTPPNPGRPRLSDPVTTPTPSPPTNPSAFTLSTLKLPPFDGVLGNWEEFWALFAVAIDRNPRLDPVEKLVHLKSLLKGEALSAIRGIPITGSNYQLILDQLVRRFSRPESRREELLRSLVSFPPLKIAHDLTQTRRDLDNLLTTVRQLEVAGCPPEQYSTVVVPLLEGKLPPEWRMVWVREKRKEKHTPSLEELLRFMEEETRVLEEVRPPPTRDPHPRSGSTTPLESPRQSGSAPPHQPWVNPASATVSATLPVTDMDRRPPTCPACNGSLHRLLQCAAFIALSPQDRTRLMRRDNRCFRCLGKHSRDQPCKGGPCSHCGNGKHHRTLCFQASDSQSQGPPGQRPREPQAPRWSSPSTTPNPSHYGQNNSSTASPQFRPSAPRGNPQQQNPQQPYPQRPGAFFPTATPHSSAHPMLSAVPATPSGENVGPSVFVKIGRASVSTPGGRGLSTNVFVYLDDGAKRTYIRTDLARALSLPVEQEAPLTTGSFGEQVMTQMSQQVSLDIVGLHGGCSSLPLMAWTTPRLCPPMRQEFLAPSLMQLDAFGPWADAFDGGERTISLLIGADQIWKVTGQIYPITPSLRVLETAFGQVLSGTLDPGPHRGGPGGIQPSMLVSDVTNLWDLEAIGVGPPTASDHSYPPPVRSPDDPQRYRATLPFKNDRRPHQNQTQVQRQQQTRYDKAPPVRQQQIDEHIQALLDRGTVEPATTPSDVGYCLPHHMCVRKKPRLVFDGSSPDASGVSLNHCLDPGPLPAPQLVIVEEDGPPLPWIEIERYSSLEQVVRVVAYVKRFIHRASPRHVDKRRTGPLTPEEKDEALRLLIRHEQRIHYESELESLEARHPLPRTSSLIKLRPAVLSDLIHLVPRTREEPLPILPPRSPLTRLIVRHYHETMLHQGASATLGQVRTRYWIPRGRSLIKQLIHHCPPCRRYRSQPYRTPEAALAPFRSIPLRPFTVTGLDFFGPILTVPESRDDAPEGIKKAWVILFICASVRCIHMEVVADGRTNTTHLAIRRFLARRVPPFQRVQFRSDNAPVFHALSVMKFPSHPTTWLFTPAYSPHWGGWWERLIKVIKTSMRITGHRSRLTFLELSTFVSEVESVVNARPLTEVSADPLDLAPITPADFLYGPAPPTQQMDPSAVTDETLRETLQCRDGTNRLLWRTWHREYLAALRVWRQRRPILLRIPRVGDLVLVHQDSPRGTWPLARITRLLIGPDGVPRAAELRMRGRTTTRSAHLLYPLEAEPLRQEPLDQEPLDQEPLEQEPPEPRHETPGRDTPQPLPVSVQPPNPTRTTCGREVRVPDRFRD